MRIPAAGNDGVGERAEALHEGIAGAARLGARRPIDHTQQPESLVPPAAERRHDGRVSCSVAV
jgi:hypothetical protein